MLATASSAPDKYKTRGKTFMAPNAGVPAPDIRRKCTCRIPG